MRAVRRWPIKQRLLRTRIVLRRVFPCRPRNANPFPSVVFFAPPSVTLFHFAAMAMTTAKKPGPSSAAPAPSSDWPDRAVSILLKTYAQKFSADRGYLRTQDWQEVAHAVNSVCDNPKTMKQCRDKVDSLKRRYKIEKRKAVTGGEVSWPFFHRLEDIMNAVLKQGKVRYSAHPNPSSANASADADGGDDLDMVEEAVDFHKRKEDVADAGVRVQERQDEVGADGNDNDDAQEDNDGLNSTDSLSASSDIPPNWKNRKSLRHNEEDDDDDDMSEEEDDTFNDYCSRHLHRPLQNRNHHGHPQNSFRSHAQRRPEHVFHDYFLHPPLLVPSRPSTLSGGTQESTENASHERRKRTFSHLHKRKHECDNGIDALADAVTGLSKPCPGASFTDLLTRIENAKAAILKKMRVELSKLDKPHKKGSTSRKLHSSLATSG